MQTTAHLLMIRPAHFNFNAETAENNHFQIKSTDPNIPEKALAEFDRLVQLLRDYQVDVTVVQDSLHPYTPDSIFPNNWISFHSDGTICLYPMYAENRRQERKPAVFAAINEKFEIGNTIDYSGQEERNIFLEGTGSMVLDRSHHLAYACLSERTNENVLQQFCDEMGYQPVVFSAIDNDGEPIYHTNVMMCVADRFVLICLDAIPNEIEKQWVQEQILATEKSIIPISMEQMNHFAGNMLQINNRMGEKLLVMSSQAFHSLDEEQIQTLENFNTIIHADIKTIESNGGGSARCMIAEMFLPLKTY